jgi:hypothetical protein
MAKAAARRSPSLAAIARAVEGAVSSAVAEAIPKALHAEFLKLGLATDGEDKQLNAQRDFAFLRSARLDTEAGKRAAFKTVINWGIGGILTAAAGYVGMMIHSGATPMK